MSNVVNRIDQFGFLAVRSERDGDKDVIALTGELDVDGVQRVTQELRRAEATAAHQIVLDLSNLEFIDSSGIQLIFEADARSRADGKRLRLVRGPHNVQRVFELTGLVDRLPFID